MKVTYNWLKDFVDIPWSPEETAEKLTMAGLEVEEVITKENYIEGVIAGKIISIEPHPDSEKLRICLVDLGTDRKNIVCGAPNVMEGMMVPVAIPGTKLPNSEIIQITKIRGVESFGMICSEYELGISDVSDVVMELKGSFRAGDKFISEKFQKDYIFDIFITPNRPDCLGVIGIAREIAALSGQKIRKPEIKINESPDIGENFCIEIKDIKNCPRYSARILEGIVVKPSPVWLINRLNSVDIRAINNIVDATNYVLMELGQPMHAFDYNLISGNKIIVQPAKENEEFITLDGIRRILDSNTLLICDNEKGVAIAGVMGGLNSEINENTTKILLESANFNPLSVRRTSRKLGLSSEASKRFERGTDPEITLYALDRVCQIISESSFNVKVSKIYDEYPGKKKNKKVSLRIDRTNKILGTNFSEEEILNTLKNLEFEIKKDKNIEVKIPSFRHDIEREIDLIEEVSRILGYERIRPIINLKVRESAKKSEEERYLDRFKNLFMSLGFNEVITYSMIDEKFNKYFDEPEKSIFVKNPISKEISLLRRSLVPSLLNVALLNFNRGVDNIRIFEIGKVYWKDNTGKADYREENYLSAIAQGKIENPMWKDKSSNINIFFVKGIVETFLDKIFLDNYKIFYYDKSDLKYSYG
ncbi:phenylalanine--tRNA ligase subunit beta, partial [candidate division KSB1 bacterium]